MDDDVLAAACLEMERAHGGPLLPPEPYLLHEDLGAAQTIRVWYHGEGCRDGFGAAYAAWKLWGDRPTYVSLSHGDPVPEWATGDAIYILDFSFDRETLEEIEQEAGYLQVIDHHESARKALEGLDFAIFDMEHSGAVLAWQHLHPQAPVPELLLYVEDRDLWAWKLDKSREVSWALRSYPLGDFELWDGFDVETLKQEGAHIRRFAELETADGARKAFLATLGDVEMPVVNSLHYRSEIPDTLLEQGHPAAATYSDGPAGRLWSLRSNGAVDVAELAERFGGGGHKEASGFREETPGEKVKLTWPVEKAGG